MPDDALEDKMADLDELRSQTGYNQTPYEYKTGEYWDFVKGYQNAFRDAHNR